MISVVVSGSPLAALGTVIRDKSTAALPFKTCLVMWLSSACWLGYGALVAGDPKIYIPNSLGFALASSQMLLFVIFGFHSPNKIAHKDSVV